MAKAVHVHVHVHTAASTAEQAWGEQADIDWAREYVEKNVGAGRLIHAVLRPTNEAIQIISTRHIRCCIWPHLLLTSPCLICCCINTRQSLSHMIYILTNREICRIIRPHQSTCSCPCCGTVTSACDEQIVPLQSILLCDHTNAGNECCLQTDVDSVRIYQVGASILHQYYVQEPDQFVRLVNEVRDANAQQHPAPTSGLGPPPAYPMPTSAPPAYGSSAAITDPIIATSSGIRIFVALSTNPSQFEIIVNFQPQQGLDGLSKLVANQFHQPAGVRYAFTMAELGASVNDAQAIQTNDKLIATATKTI